MSGDIGPPDKTLTFDPDRPERADVLVMESTYGDRERPPVDEAARRATLAAEVRDAIRIAHQVSEWTAGRFDVTFGALSGLWKFDDQDKDGRVPDRAEVLKKLTLVNYRDLIVDEGAGTAVEDGEEPATGVTPALRARAWSRYAHALARTDRTTDALNAASRALDLAPEDREVRDLRDRLRERLPRELQAAG